MNDLISRQAAIDVITHELRCGAVIDQCGLETAHDLIEELPSVQPERMRGKWIKRSGTINCSICKHSNWSECFEDTVMSFNFCPNCGAKMER